MAAFVRREPISDVDGSRVRTRLPGALWSESRWVRVVGGLVQHHAVAQPLLRLVRAADRGPRPFCDEHGGRDHAGQSRLPQWQDGSLITQSALSRRNHDADLKLAMNREGGRVRIVVHAVLHSHRVKSDAKIPRRGGVPRLCIAASRLRTRSGGVAAWGREARGGTLWPRRGEQVHGVHRRQMGR